VAGRIFFAGTTVAQHSILSSGAKPSDQPEWLTERFYKEQIQPHLIDVSAPRLAAALGVSKLDAVEIRGGRRRPHPRHWRALAELVGGLSSGEG